MSKYVPRFLQGAKVTPQETVTPVTQEPKVASVSRWTPLVNTSLPAKEAPVLPSATLASLTKKDMPPGLQPVTGASLKQAKPLPKEEDFPTLGKPAVVKVDTTTSKPTFSELSKQWAIKKKEEEEKEEELAKQEADMKRAESARRQKEESNIRSIKIITLPSVKREIDDDGNDKRTTGSDSDEVDPFDDGLEEDDVEEEVEMDDGWGYRKHRNELY